MTGSALRIPFRPPTPWLDRHGRWSWLRGAVLLGVCLPAALMLGDLAAGTLGARPFEELQDRTGFWAAWLLMASLAVTPLRRAWRWPRLVPLRRMIGVAAAAYALAHLLGYALDRGMDVAYVASEIAKRAYLVIGFAGVLGLSVLAANLSVDPNAPWWGVRPGVAVLAAGLLVAAGSALRRGPLASGTGSRRRDRAPISAGVRPEQSARP